MENNKGNIISEAMKTKKDNEKEKVPFRNTIQHTDNSIDYTDAFISGLSTDSANKANLLNPVTSSNNFKKRLKIIKAVIILSSIVLIVSAVMLKKDMISGILERYKFIKTDVIKNKEKKLTILERKVSKLSKEKKTIEKKIEDMSLKSTMLIKQTVSQKKKTSLIGKENRLYKKKNEDLKMRMKDMAKLLEYYKNQSPSKTLAELKNKNHELNSEISKIKELTGKIKKEREIDMKKLEALTLNINTFKKTLTATEEKLAQSKMELINTHKQFVGEKAAIHYNLGYFYKEKKMFEEAIKEYNTALEFTPNDPDIHYNMAIIYDDFLDENELAVKHYKNYLKLAPDASDFDSVRAWMETAQDEG